MAPHHLRMLTARRRNVARLQLLVDDLLTLSKAEASSTSLEQVDLATVIRPVVTDVHLGRHATRHPARRVDPEGGAARPRRPGDAAPGRPQRPQQRRQVQPPGRRSWRSSSPRTSREAIVVVRDHGIGIPAGRARPPRDRVSSGPPTPCSKDIAGSGLGIRIVQTIMEKHAGSMLIESTVGEGTTVTLRLPPPGRPGRRVLISSALAGGGTLDRWFRFTPPQVAEGDPATARGHHEEGHPPGLRRDRGHLHLWREVHHAQHCDVRHHPRRRVLAVPPVLHRQAEDPRHRRPRRPLRGPLRQEEG